VGDTWFLLLFSHLITMFHSIQQFPFEMNVIRQCACKRTTKNWISYLKSNKIYLLNVKCQDMFKYFTIVVVVLKSIVTWTYVYRFSCVIKSYYDEALNKWMIALLDVTDGKDQVKGQLMIMNIKGVVFFPLTFFIFKCFCCLYVMKFGLFFMKC